MDQRLFKLKDTVERYLAMLVRHGRIAITRMTKDGVTTDNKTFTNLAATSASFPLLGGTMA